MPGLVSKGGPPGGLVTVSLPSVPGVTVSLPTLSSPASQSVPSIQPGQSLLTSSKVQPGKQRPFPSLSHGFSLFRPVAVDI